MNQSELKSLLHYDPETGVLTRFSTGRPCGSIYRNQDGNTYLRVNIGQKHYFAHRLAWLYMRGEWPSGQIDHIDHDGTNNALRNLRVVDAETNQKNTGLSAKNKTGISGVCFVARSQRWHAWVSRNKKQDHLGVFGDFFEACCVRKSAEARHNYHPNHGASP